jgi:hypothetical protein
LAIVWAWHRQFGASLSLPSQATGKGIPYINIVCELERIELVVRGTQLAQKEEGEKQRRVLQTKMLQAAKVKGQNISEGPRQCIQLLKQWMSPQLRVSDLK